MARVAGKDHPSFGLAIGEEFARHPQVGADDLIRQVDAGSAFDPRDGINVGDRFGILRPDEFEDLASRSISPDQVSGADGFDTAGTAFEGRGDAVAVLLGTGAERNQMPIAAMAAAMGGNVRVGLEDSLWLDAGRLAESNAAQVRRNGCWRDQFARTLRDMAAKVLIVSVTDMAHGTNARSQ